MTTWELMIFQKIGDDLVDHAPADGVTTELVQRIWSLPSGDPGFDSYPVTADNVDELRPLVGVPLDLDHFDYFVEQV